MNRRIKKKHERYYWLRNAKERRVTWQEFLGSFTRKLTPEEIAECITQGTEDAKKELAELEEREYVNDTN